jgi:5-methylcytosine-specific restriction protein A
MSLQGLKRMSGFRGMNFRTAAKRSVFIESSNDFSASTPRMRMPAKEDSEMLKTVDKRLLLVGSDGSHRYPVVYESAQGVRTYKVGSGIGGVYEEVEDFSEVLRRVLLLGKVISARSDVKGSDATGVLVPGKSISSYWLLPELRPVVAGAKLPSLDAAPAFSGVVAPPSQAVLWSDDQLRAAVSAYLGMMADQKAGLAFDKTAIYAELASTLGRTAYSIDLRMQNISSVLASMGRASLDGVKVAEHVGTRVAARIESLISETEGHASLPIAAFEDAVATMVSKGMATRPQGFAKPSTTTSTATVYQRDPAVKAWVLLRAKGKCEACPNHAPFTSRAGFPFLEVHHVRPLAEGGSDRTTNSVALCPNCHRWLHHGKDAEAVRQKLFVNVAELIPE